MSALRFAAIGLNHNHIYGQVELPAARRRRARRLPRGRGRPRRRVRGEPIPQAKRVADRRAILEDDVDRAGSLTAGDPGRARRDRDRGDAPRQGRDERQAGHDDARPARRGQARAGRDRPHLLDPLLRAFRDAARRSRPASSSPRARSARWSTPSASARTGCATPSAAGLVLRARALWRHPHRHRRAPVSSSSCSSPATDDAEVLSATRRQPRQSRHARAAGRRRHAPRAPTAPPA